MTSKFEAIISMQNFNKTCIFLSGLDVRTSCRYSSCFAFVLKSREPERQTQGWNLNFTRCLACLNKRTEAELQTEPELEWRLADNYLQLCHFLFHSVSLLVSMVCAAVCRFTRWSSSFRSDTLQSDVTHWRLRWQLGRQGHTVTYF